MLVTEVSLRLTNKRSDHRFRQNQNMWLGLQGLVHSKEAMARLVLRSAAQRCWCTCMENGCLVY
jgi:hypothetical protein